MTISKIIYTARTKKGFTQKRLGKKLGYTTGQSVSNWERGENTPPSNMIPKICKVLGLRPRALAQ